jgi:hypothetical protein
MGQAAGKLQEKMLPVPSLLSNRPQESVQITAGHGADVPGDDACRPTTGVIRSPMT